MDVSSEFDLKLAILTYLLLTIIVSIPFVKWRKSLVIES